MEILKNATGQSYHKRSKNPFVRGLHHSVNSTAHGIKLVQHGVRAGINLTIHDPAAIGRAAMRTAKATPELVKRTPAKLLAVARENKHVDRLVGHVAVAARVSWEHALRAGKASMRVAAKGLLYAKETLPGGGGAKRRKKRLGGREPPSRKDSSSKAESSGSGRQRQRE